jgi:hypothetical protein
MGGCPLVEALLMFRNKAELFRWRVAFRHKKKGRIKWCAPLPHGLLLHLLCQCQQPD